MMKSVLNGQLYSTAQSRDQAAVLYNLCVKMVLMSPRLKAFITIRETKKELACPRRGTVYRALSKESKTALGLSPVSVPASLLACRDAPEKPAGDYTQMAVGGYIIGLHEAHADCHAKLGAVRGALSK